MSTEGVADPIVLDCHPGLTVEQHRNCLPEELAPLECLPPEGRDQLNAALNSAYLQSLRIAWSRNRYVLRLDGDPRLTASMRKTAQRAETVAPAIVTDVHRQVAQDFDPTAALRWCADQVLYVDYVLAVNPTGDVDLRVATGRPASYQRHRLTAPLLEQLSVLAQADTTWPAPKPAHADTQSLAGMPNWLPCFGLPDGHWGSRHSARFQWRGLLTTALLASPFWPFTTRRPSAQPAEDIAQAS